MENQNQNPNDEPDQIVMMRAANLTELNKNLQSLLQELRKQDNSGYSQAVVGALGRLSKELQLKMVDVEKAAKTPPAAIPAPNVTVRPPQVQVDAPDISGIERLLNKQLPALVQKLVDGMPEVPETDLSTLEDLLKGLKTTMAQVRDRPLPVPQMPTTLKVTNPDGTLVGAGGGGGGGAVTVADGADVTLGSKADAKSTATDTTAVTIMQVLKQISASAQAPPSQAVTNAGIFAVQATQSGTWTVQPGNTANTTPWLVKDQAWSVSSQTNLTTTATVSPAAGTYSGGSFINLNSAPAYLQFFDTTGAVTLGSTAPTFVQPIPANATAANGAAFVFHIPGGISLANGLKVAATTTATGSTTVSTGLIGFITYK